MMNLNQDSMPKKILVADDEEHIVSFLSVVLKKEGFEVVAAYDGEEAKEKFNSEHPDLVLLDLDMPIVNGWQFLAWLRKEGNLSTPVIIVSGRDQMSDIKSGYEFEADYYLVKPLNIKDILKGIAIVSSLKSQSRNGNDSPEI